MHATDNTSADLLRQSKRIARGYVITLVVIASLILLGYLVLSRSLADQQKLNSLYVATNAIQASLRNTLDHTTDLKKAIESGNSSNRMLRQIRSRIKSDLIELRNLHQNAAALVAQMGNKQPELHTLYNAAPHQLNERLRGYIARVEVLLANSSSDASDGMGQWTPLDATMSKQGYLITGYQRVNELAETMLQQQSARLQRFHNIQSILLGIALILVTLLIFVPLTRGLKKVHERIVRAQRDLEYLAYNDPVTGLPTSTGLAHQVKLTQQMPNDLYVLQLRNMNSISDQIGPANRDAFFSALAQSLQQLVPSSAHLARSSDEEFCVLLTQGSQLSSEQEQLLMLREGLTIEQQQLYPAIAPGRTSMAIDDDLDDKLIDARLAANTFIPGGQTLPLFTRSMRDVIGADNELTQEIRAAIERREFVPYYQLKVDAVNGQPVGMEALCRWIHPHKGMISPGVFIPAAERNGTIVDITWLIIEQVCTDLRDWHNAGCIPGHVAVNIAESVLQDPGFSNRLEQSIADVPVPLEIEITENVALANYSGSVESSLARIRELGLRVALDDFGTGFASLSTIVELDLDVIKIDQSFVADMTENLKNRTVVESIISICKTLNKHCVAEGVETQEQATLLRDMGCQTLQGYLFYRPTDADTTRRVLSEIRPPSVQAA